MANRGFIMAVVLIVAAAMLFSGYGGGTGAYKNQVTRSTCPYDFEYCMDGVSNNHDKCYQMGQGFQGCRNAFDDGRKDCMQRLYDCLGR